MELQSIGAGQYRVKGRLTFETVTQALKSTSPDFSQSNAVQIDLSEVKGFDSAGLALMIEWFVRATLANTTVTYTGVPPSLFALAKISNLDQLLALQSPAA